MLLLDETSYADEKELLQAAPTPTPKAAGMAVLKFPVDVAGAGLLIAGGLDQLIFERDNFFRIYDEEIRPVQQALTPEPGSVTTAGRIISGISGFAPALALGPAGIPVLAGQSAINTGAELVEQGVDPATATLTAAVTGAAGTAMAGIPAAGKTWGKTFALAATNPLIGAASTEAEKQLLEARGYEEVARGFDPFDPAGRTIDAVMGLAFGAMGKYSLARQQMLTRAKDSIDTVANWQRMFKDTPFDTSDPTTADLGYKAMQKALADIAEGRPVDLSGVVPDAPRLQRPDAPVRAEAVEAKAKIAEALAEDARLQEHRIDRGLREHVQELMDAGDLNAVLDLVYKDPLTQTYNQKGWKRLEASGDLEGVAQGKSDLKKFKYLNDTYGDAFGDEVIAQSGKYLSEEPNVKVFRIGGDETAVVSTRNNLQDVVDAYESANRKLMAHVFTGTKKDGTLVDITGVDLVYGTGKSPDASAASRAAEKQRLIDAKQYAAGRGDKSINLVERPSARVPDMGRTGEARPDLGPAPVPEAAAVTPAENLAAGQKQEYNTAMTPKKGTGEIPTGKPQEVKPEGGNWNEKADYYAKNVQRLAEENKPSGRLMQAYKYGKSMREKLERGAWEEAKSKKLTVSGKDFEPNLFTRKELESYAMRHDIDFDYAEGSDNAAIRAFGRAGFLGQPIPEFRVGWRYGKIPELERSYNYREQVSERGVSLMDLFDPAFTSGDAVKIYEMFNAKKDMRIVGGYYVGRGTDGEPLIVSIKDLTNASISDSLRPPKEGGQVVSAPQKTKNEIRAELKGYGELWQDPTVQRVEQRLAEEGDFPVHVGTDFEGKPASVSARDFIEAAKRDYKALEAQQDIYQRISDCL